LFVAGIAMILLAVIVPWLVASPSDAYGESGLLRMFKTIMPTLALLAIILLGLFLAAYQLAILVLAMVMKEYFFAVGIFFVSLLSFIFKYLKGRELE